MPRAGKLNLGGSVLSLAVVEQNLDIARCQGEPGGGARVHRPEQRPQMVHGKPLPHKAAGFARINRGLTDHLRELVLDDHAVVWVAAVLGLVASRCEIEVRRVGEAHHVHKIVGSVQCEATVLVIVGAVSITLLIQ
jgi:hypothetical protein